MSYPSATRLDNIAFHAGPSPLGTWIGAALRRLIHTAPTPTPPRDRVREAAEVRAWATTVSRHDPRFAADLFAAADRHELEGS